MPQIIKARGAHGARYNQVVFKASHNSYQRAEQPITKQIPFDTEKPHQCGCRGLELDIRPNDDATEWSVGHFGGYEAEEEKQLRHYLGILDAWSVENPEHDVITVHLDLKGVPEDLGAFPAGLDAYITSVMDRDRIFTAGELLGDHENLREASRAGWPTLGELEGKFILCLSGNEDGKRSYATTDPGARVCFADRLLGTDEDLPEEDLKHRVFLNVAMGEWMRTLPRLGELAQDESLVIRAFFASQPDWWNAARRYGVNVIGTDKVSQLKWCKVTDDSPFDLVRVVPLEGGAGG
jgi:hypothetical protein